MFQDREKHIGRCYHARLAPFEDVGGHPEDYNKIVGNYLTMGVEVYDVNNTDSCIKAGFFT